MRFTVMTKNLWNTIRWDERKECVRLFFRLYSPDIICLQEVRPELLSWIDESLPDYSRIRDPFAGWTNEGSIYYRNEGSVLDSWTDGAGDIPLLSPPQRRAESCRVD